jgi:hypothetical protein
VLVGAALRGRCWRRKIGSAGLFLLAPECLTGTFISDTLTYHTRLGSLSHIPSERCYISECAKQATRAKVTGDCDD